MGLFKRVLLTLPLFLGLVLVMRIETKHHDEYGQRRIGRFRAILLTLPLLLGLLIPETLVPCLLDSRLGI